MQNDWVNYGALTSHKYLLNAVWSELRFVFGDMPVDVVTNARIVVER